MSTPIRSRRAWAAALVGVLWWSSILTAQEPVRNPPGAASSTEAPRVVAQRLADDPLVSQPVPGRLDWWREARFGMFIHWGLYAIPAGEWGGKTSHAEWIRTTGKIPREEYEKFRERFNPTKFDARAWVKLAKSAGMKYITITTKHHDGFCLFDSKETDWDVMSTPFQRDIIKEMADACRAEGITLCFYYSIMDWHHPDYTPRRDWETWDTKGADFERYVRYMKAQLKELLTNYGPIGVLWFDGQWEGNWNDERGKDLYEYVRSLQPNIIVNSRVGRAGGDWGLDGESGMLGDYATPEQTIPDEVPADVDWETCMTMNGHWGYNKADKEFKSTKDLVRKLADIASKGGNFLLNVGPTAEGEIPAESVQRLQEIGKWMAVNGDSIHGTRGGPLAKTPWGRTTQRTLPGPVTRMYLHVFEAPKDGRLIVPGVLNKPLKSFMMAAPDSALEAQNIEDAIVITLPQRALEPLDEVVVLDVPGAADVMKPPVITAPSTIFLDRIEAEVTTEQQMVEIRYTTDGSDPSAQSPAVTGTVELHETGILAARCFRDARPVSPIARQAFTKATPRAATAMMRNTGEPSTRPELTPGVRYDYFQTGGPGANDGVDFKSVAELDSLTPLKPGKTGGFETSVRLREKHWGVKYKGWIKAPRTAVYRFAVGSDDGSRLWIGDQLVVENDGPHSYKVESGEVALAKGYHQISVGFFENWGGFDLKVFWSEPGGKREAIPADALWCAP